MQTLSELLLAHEPSLPAVCPVYPNIVETNRRVTGTRAGFGRICTLEESVVITSRLSMPLVPGTMAVHSIHQTHHSSARHSASSPLLPYPTAYYGLPPYLAWH